MTNNTTELLLIFAVQTIILFSWVRCQTSNLTVCGDAEFDCQMPRTNVCIPQSKVCDGKLDCPNSVDEQYELCETKICDPLQFHCARGGCISIYNVCNQVADCVDGSDEDNCDNPAKKCPDSLKMTCYSGDECIESYEICDGKKDCADNSDETTTICYKVKCPAYLFTCNNGACVNRDGVCDGKPDCNDYSDELLPECRSNITINMITEFMCGKNAFRCKSGLCISDQKVCNGIRDCDDGSDETFRQCKDTECPPGVRKCMYGACQMNDSCVDGQRREGYIPDRNNFDKCRFPYPLQNGVMKTNTGINYTVYENVPEWTILIFTCDEGYSLGSDQSVIVCMDNVWTNPFPRCHKTCPNLESDKHKIECSHNGISIPCNKAYAGTIANIKCIEAFEVLNLVYQPYNGIQCQANGNWSNPLFDCNPQCGILTPKGQALIIKGYTASKGDFPWHAGIYRRKTVENNFEQICGGTLISEKVILSAAHCFWDWDNYRPSIDLEKYAVGIGKYYRDWNNTEDKHAQQFKPAKIILPQRFRAEESSFANDIAIIILNNSVKLTALVRPVCIDWSNELYKTLLRPGSIGIVPGWGLTSEFGQPSSELLAVQMPFIEYHACLRNLPEVFRPFITSDKICAGHKNGTSVCTGDSGGSISFKSRDRYFIGGVVSVSPAKGPTCDSSKYVAFTSVPHHLKFIIKIERELQPKN